MHALTHPHTHTYIHIHIHPCKYKKNFRNLLIVLLLSYNINFICISFSYMKRDRGINKVLHFIFHMNKMCQSLY